MQPDRWHVFNRGEQMHNLPTSMVEAGLRQGTIACDASIAADGGQQWLPIAQVHPFAAVVASMRSQSLVGTKWPSTKKQYAVLAALTAFGVLSLVGAVTGRNRRSTPPAPALTWNLDSTPKAAPTAEKKESWSASAPSDGCMGDTSVTGTCKAAVRDKLTAPSTAKFPGLFAEKDVVVHGPGCVRSWSSWVESTNAFNARIRNTFTCKITPPDSIEVTFE